MADFDRLASKLASITGNNSRAGLELTPALLPSMLNRPKKEEAIQLEMTADCMMARQDAEALVKHSGVLSIKGTADDLNINLSIGTILIVNSGNGPIVKFIKK
ncbi:MAG: hypothetical protein ABW007_18995 [Chitinophagaceae bacterium]